MEQNIFDLSDWYRAASLNERAAAWHAAGVGGDVIHYDDVRGSKRLRRWREQANFKNDQVFIERLEAEGLAEEQLRQLLGEDADAVKSRSAETPSWLTKWTSAFWSAYKVESPMAPMTKDQWRESP